MQPITRRNFNSRQTIVAVLLGLVVAALLASGSLVGLAERQKIGATRDLALPAARGIDRVSSFLSLDRPASVLSAVFDEPETSYDIDTLIAVGRNQTTPTSTEPPEPTSSPSVPPGGTTSSVPELEPEPDPNPSSAPTTVPIGPAAPTTTPPTTPTDPTPPSTAPPTPTNPAPPNTSAPQIYTAPPPVGTPFASTRRQVTQNQPLKLWVGGDSQTLALTRGFGRVIPTTLTNYTSDAHLSSGLTRPDFLDWPQRLAKLLIENRPEVLVIMFGGNDYQDVYHSGQLLKRPSQGWLDFYRSRVVEAMDLLNQPDIEVIWVGTPIMRGEFFATGMAHLNEIYRSEAASRSSIQYFDSWNMFADANGNYTDRIGGQLVRESDGIHLTTAGGVLLAEAIWETIAPRWGITS